MTFNIRYFDFIDKIKLKESLIFLLPHEIDSINLIIEKIVIYDILNIYDDKIYLNKNYIILYYIT